ncbi:MAG: hypothetical protein PGN13_09100 [Patulibacter minatonensis]
MSTIAIACGLGEVAEAGELGLERHHDLRRTIDVAARLAGALLGGSFDGAQITAATGARRRRVVGAAADGAGVALGQARGELGRHRIETCFARRQVDGARILPRLGHPGEIAPSGRRAAGGGCSRAPAFRSCCRARCGADPWSARRCAVSTLRVFQRVDHCLQRRLRVVDGRQLLRGGPGGAEPVGCGRCRSLGNREIARERIPALHGGEGGSELLAARHQRGHLRLGHLALPGLLLRRAEDRGELVHPRVGGGARPARLALRSPPRGRPPPRAR